MRVLAIAPQEVVLNHFRTIALLSPEVEWDVVVVSKTPHDEPMSWARRVHHLGLGYSRLIPEPPPAVPSEVDERVFAYEIACAEMRAPELKWYIDNYWDVCQDGCQRLTNHLLDRVADCDCVVLWGERCWYNVVARTVADSASKPVLYLERAAFPGMLVADRRGLDQDTSEVTEAYANNPWGECEEREFNAWAPIAAQSTIEPQRGDTLGEVLAGPAGGGVNILVPLQVPYDTNMIFRLGDVGGNMELVEDVVHNRSDDSRVLVKMHPRDHFSDRDRVFWSCHKLGATLVDYGLPNLLDASDHVVSLNSQVVIDAALRQVSFGLLARAGFMPNIPPEDLDVRRWLHTLRFRYYVGPHQVQDRIREAIACQT